MAIFKLYWWRKMSDAPLYIISSTNRHMCRTTILLPSWIAFSKTLEQIEYTAVRGKWFEVNTLTTPPQTLLILLSKKSKMIITIAKITRTQYEKHFFRAFFPSITGADIRPLHNSKLHFFFQKAAEKNHNFKRDFTKCWDFVFKIHCLPSGKI
jgi:hypothetical protein